MHVHVEQINRTYRICAMYVLKFRLAENKFGIFPKCVCSFIHSKPAHLGGDVHITGHVPGLLPVPCSLYFPSLRSVPGLRSLLYSRRLVALPP